MKYFAMICVTLSLGLAGCDGDVDRPTNEPKMKVDTGQTPDLDPRTDDDVDVNPPDIDVDVENRPGSDVPDIQIDANQPADKDTEANENEAPAPQ